MNWAPSLTSCDFEQATFPLWTSVLSPAPQTLRSPRRPLMGTTVILQNKMVWSHSLVWSVFCMLPMLTITAPNLSSKMHCFQALTQSGLDALLFHWRLCGTLDRIRKSKDLLFAFYFLIPFRILRFLTDHLHEDQSGFFALSSHKGSPATPMKSLMKNAPVSFA